MLSWLGKFGKGFATIIGLALAALGVSTGLVDANVKEALTLVIASGPALVKAVILLLGAIATAFGIGRKAAVAAGALMDNGQPWPEPIKDQQTDKTLPRVLFPPSGGGAGS